MGPAGRAQGTVAVLLTLLAPPCHTRIYQLASKQLAAAGRQLGGKREEQPKMPQPLLCTGSRLYSSFWQRTGSVKL